METKFCENCGAKMPIESKFCTECGTPFPKAEPKKEEPAPAVAADPEPEKPAEPAEPAEAVETPYEAPIELPARDPEPVIPAAPIPPVTPNPAPAQPQPQTQPVQQPYGQPAQPAQPVRPAPQPQQPAYAQPVKPAPTAYGTPVYGAAAVDPEITKESVKGTKYEPVSALGWFGIFLLVGIPLVGPLLVIIWACCGCRKQNKRTFARGILISWLVGLIIAGLLGLALRSKIIDFAKDYAAENGIAYSEGTVIEDVLNSFLNRYGYEIAK